MNIVELMPEIEKVLQKKKNKSYLATEFSYLIVI